MQILIPEEEVQLQETRLRQHIVIDEEHQENLRLYKIH